MNKNEQSFKNLQEEEIKKNFKVFEEKLPDILKEYTEGYVLMKNGEIKGVFSTLQDVLHASQLIEDGLYSIQEINDKPINLGYYSHAMVQ